MPASIAFQRPNLKRRNEDSHGKREGISLEGEGVRVKGATSDLKVFLSLPALAYRSTTEIMPKEHASVILSSLALYHGAVRYTRLL